MGRPTHADRHQPRWHSWDPTPWRHPWLTPENLRRVRNFDGQFFQRVIAAHGSEPHPGAKFGFVGNLANNMALRALPLRRRGVPITLYLHPSDRYVMSQPGWELSDAVLETNETNVDRLASAGIVLPDVADTITLPAQDYTAGHLPELARTTPAAWWRPAHSPFAKRNDVLQWPSYFSYLPALHLLRSCTALFAAQTPYLAYLSGRPYLAGQTGGDLWLDASRNDELGTLQRHSYARAVAILATNPWAYANARRFRFQHVVYVPLIIDTEAYSPGPRTLREYWQREVGGDFFVLMTSRLDRRWKGSQIALDAFARLAATHPGARLVVIGWGAHTDGLIGALETRGLSGRYVRVPVSGKRRVVEYLRAADCVLDQFVIGYYGASALEAMSAGVPVIMRLARAQYDALCATGAPPVLDADSEDEAAAQLERLADNAEERRRIGAASRQWVEQDHGVDVLKARYVSLLNAAASGAALDFHRAPLTDRLGADEREYHEAGLRDAPPFPHYDI
jgi:glycosyltransferase involved in cell wall biosynthesis